MSFETRYSGYEKWWWYTPKHTWRTAFDPFLPRNIPAVPGCYALSLDGKVIYVGQTLNLRTRFYSHRIKVVGDFVFKSKTWGDLRGDLRLKIKFGQRYGDWAMREARLIERLAPTLNKRLI